MPGLTRPTSGGYTVRSPIGTDNQQTFSKRKQAVLGHRVVTVGVSSGGRLLRPSPGWVYDIPPLG